MAISEVVACLRGGEAYLPEGDDNSLEARDRGAYNLHVGFRANRACPQCANRELNHCPTIAEGRRS